MIGICMDPFVFLIGDIKSSRKPDKSVAYDDLAVCSQIDERFHQLGYVGFVKEGKFRAGLYQRIYERFFQP